MKLSTTAVVAILSFCSQLASAIPTETFTKSLESATALIWKGPIFPGDAHDAHTLQGDARDIYNQIVAINPSFNATDFADPAETKRALQRRNKGSIICAISGYGDGDYFNLASEISYLYNIGGSCNVGAGPRTCVRMACINTSGTYLCNDGPNPIGPQCNYLASYAEDIQDRCGSGFAPDTFYNGQEFDTDKYNVIAGYANCNHSPHQNPF